MRKVFIVQTKWDFNIPSWQDQRDSIVTLYATCGFILFIKVMKDGFRKKNLKNCHRYVIRYNTQMLH